MLILRKLFAVLILLTAATVLSVPAAASNLHKISHVGSTTIAAASSHHHASVEDTKSDTGQTDDQQNKNLKHNGVSHNHVGEVATADPMVVPAGFVSSGLPQGDSAAVLSSLVLPPQDRPPRTA